MGVPPELFCVKIAGNANVSDRLFFGSLDVETEFAFAVIGTSPLFGASGSVIIQELDVLYINYVSDILRALFCVKTVGNSAAAGVDSVGVLDEFLIIGDIVLTRLLRTVALRGVDGSDLALL